MGQKFTVHLVGDESHQIETNHRDLMMTERQLASRGLDATGKTNPVHYVTALIWSACVRLGITAVKFDEFGDHVVDFDKDKGEGDDAPDPTRPAAPTRSPYP